MSAKFLLVFLLLFVFKVESKTKTSSAVPLTEDVDLLFRAKGLKSKDEVEALTTSLKGKPKPSAKEFCTLSLNLSFSNFANPEIASMIRKTTADGTTCYILVFKDEGLSQLSFCYRKNESKPFLWKSASLAKDWQVMSLIDTDSIVLSGKSCKFIFSTKNPLDALAVPNE